MSRQSGIFSSAEDSEFTKILRSFMIVDSTMGLPESINVSKFRKTYPNIILHSNQAIDKYIASIASSAEEQKSSEPVKNPSLFVNRQEAEKFEEARKAEAVRRANALKYNFKHMCYWNGVGPR